MKLTVTVFSSSAALLEHLRVRGTFDIYLLDVIMPGQNGIELGLSIREFDQGGRIIYLTASSDFAVDSYRAKASDYLLKPLDKSRLFQSLDNIIKSLELEPHACVMIKTREGLRRLPLHSIVYGELVGRCIQYHLSNGSVITGMSLRGSFQNAVEPLLAHRSVLHIIFCQSVLCGNDRFLQHPPDRGQNAPGVPLSPRRSNQTMAGFSSGRGDMK